MLTEFWLLPYDAMVNDSVGSVWRAPIQSLQEIHTYIVEGTHRLQETKHKPKMNGLLRQRGPGGMDSA